MIKHWSNGNISKTMYSTQWSFFQLWTRFNNQIFQRLSYCFYYDSKKLIRKSELTFYYQNVRSLVSKIDKLLTPIINSSFFNIITFSEAWLFGNISNSELDINNYTIYRCDRLLSNSNCNVGGGVLIDVHSNLKNKIY